VCNCIRKKNQGKSLTKKLDLSAATI